MRTARMQQRISVKTDLRSIEAFLQRQIELRQVRSEIPESIALKKLLEP